MPVTNLVSRIRGEVARALTDLPDQPCIVVGLSGGPDSMCLADVLLAQTDTVTCVLAHLNHCLRGAESDGDAEFVRAYAAQRGVACFIASTDVAAHAKSTQQSIETAARSDRYDFLTRIARETGAQAVAVAHHADDQAETVLHRILRGAGLEGLRAMRMRSALQDAPEITLLRPLLRVRRKEIEQYCADMRLAPRHDATNDLEDATRNKIRHSVIPLLETINPGVKQVLARLADSAASDTDVVNYATAHACNALVTQVGDMVEVDRAGWQQLPEGLQRRVLRECVRRLRSAGLTDLNYAAIEEARAVLNSPVAVGEIALMGDVRVTVRHAQFVLYAFP